MHRADRLSSYKETRGGVLIGVHRKLHTTVIRKISQINDIFISIDITGIVLHHGREEINLIGLYIPPGVSMVVIKEFLETLADTLLTLDGDLVVMGDFNCQKLFKQKNRVELDLKSRLLMEFVSTINCNQCNSVYNSHNNLLDLVLTTVTVDVENAHNCLTRVDNFHQPIQITITMLERVVSLNVKAGKKYIRSTEILEENNNNNFNVL